MANKQNSDTHFFNIFSLVLGILVAIAIVLIVLARYVGAHTQVVQQQEEVLKLKSVQENTAPVAKIAVAGQDNSALNAADAPPATAAADLPKSGEEAFGKVCTTCHTAGLAGAPKVGDKAAWAPRIAQGMDTLHKHALEGFQGKAGYMPPKGGRADLSDQSIMNAVDYLVAQAK